MKRYADFGIRALLVLLLPLGFLTVSDIFQQDYWYNFGLTAVATGCCWILLFAWSPPASRYPHVYAFFAFYVVGYFLKFYILAYMVQNEDIYWEYLDVYYRFERQILEDYRSVTLCYEISTIGLVFSTLSLGLLRAMDKYDFKDDPARALSTDPGFSFSNRSIARLLVFTVILFTSLLVVQIWLGLNLVSGDERRVVTLPYRLAGIILATHKYVVPLLFLSLLWITDRRDATNWRRTIFFFVAYGITSGVHSTSKAYLATVIIVMGLLWVITNRLTIRRFLFLGALTAFMLPFNTFLGVNRVIRILRDDVDIFDLLFLAGNIIFDSNISYEYVDIFYSDSTKSLTQFLGPLMRVNGADSLLNVINYGPTSSLPRMIFHLFESENPVNIDYATKVLGLTLESGRAFSPSLMGYFYYILGDPVLCGISLMMFFLLWHAIFALVNNSGFRLRFVISAILLMSMIHYLSEGTLESMPMNIMVILLAGSFLEVVLRLVPLSIAKLAPRSF